MPDVDRYLLPDAVSEGQPPAVEEDCVVEDDMIFVDTGAVVREESEEDGQHLLYGPENELVLLINNSGRAILTLCDGRHTVRDIVEELERRFTIPDAVSLRAAVVTYIQLLARTKLITPRPEVTA